MRTDEAMTNETGSTEHRPLRALLLDAEEGALRAARRSLEAEEFTVLSAGDGEAGLALLLDALLDLEVLVVDLDLPQRDGRAFLDLVRRRGGERDLALVVLARDATPALWAELRALGADAVVDRAAGPGALVDAARLAVAKRAHTGADAPEPPDARSEAPVRPAPSLTPRWQLALERWSLVPA